MPSNRHDRTGHPALLACGVIGPLLFIGVFLIEGAIPAIRPAGYSPLRHPISTFAIGEYGWIQVANFLLTGALLLAFALGLRPALRRYGGGIWAPVLLGLIAVGLIGAGLFTADPVNGYPPGTPAMLEGAARTTHGTLHDGFSALVFLGLPAACVVLGYRFARSGHRWWVGYCLATAVLFLTGFVLAAMGFAQNPTFVSVGGLLQRLTLITGLAWITAIASYLLHRSAKAPADVGNTVTDNTVTHDEASPQTNVGNSPTHPITRYR
jgi:hypothetical protein